MALRDQLITLINNNIRNKAPKVLKTEHADVEQAIVIDGYLKYTDSYQTLTFTDAGDTITNLSWSLAVGKSNGMINVHGKIVTSASVPVAGNYIFRWKTLYQTANNPLIPFYNFELPYFKQADVNAQGFFDLNTEGLRVYAPLPANSTLFFNVTYPSKY